MKVLTEKEICQLIVEIGLREFGVEFDINENILNMKYGMTVSDILQLIICLEHALETDVTACFETPDSNLMIPLNLAKAISNSRRKEKQHEKA